MALKIVGYILALLSGALPSVLAQPCGAGPEHFGFTSLTGENYSLVVQQGDSPCGLQECDEIGVFDGDLCVGASVFNGSWPVAVVAWKDDAFSTPDFVDGYISGHPITFRIWRSAADTEDATESVFTVGDGTFEYGPYGTAQFLCVWDCCIGRTGNVDCDPADFIDLGDLTALIDYLFITFLPLCCPEEANCDGLSDSGVGVDLGDLTALIDYLFITFVETSVCE